MMSGAPDVWDYPCDSDEEGDEEAWADDWPFDAAPLAGLGDGMREPLNVVTAEEQPVTACLEGILLRDRFERSALHESVQERAADPQDPCGLLGGNGLGHGCAPVRV